MQTASARTRHHTISLLQLPSEILIYIFDYVGPSYFRADLSRLTVCKQWNIFARIACFQDFYATQTILQRLQSSAYAEASLALIKDNAKTLDLSFTGYDVWNPTPLVQSDIRDWDGRLGRAVRASWTTELDTALGRLASTIKTSEKLRVLRIRATKEMHPPPIILERRSYLFQTTVSTILSASNLTSLELDLCGTGLLPRCSQLGTRYHICPSIAALLTTLRHLRLRLHSICSEVLRPREQGAKLRLEEVRINLDLCNPPFMSNVGHARWCFNSYNTFHLMIADLEEHAKALVAQMERPREVRIFTHSTYSNMELQGVDVLAGRNFILAEGARWDDDIIVEEESAGKSEV